MESTENSPSAALLVVDTSEVFTFDQKVIKIGRTNDNDLVIGSPKVSRKHAKLRFQNGDYELVDLKSTGGTYVNGEKIDKIRLSKGDVITLANVHLVFGGDEFPAAKLTTKYKIPDQSDRSNEDTTTLIRLGNKNKK